MGSDEKISSIRTNTFVTSGVSEMNSKSKRLLDKIGQLVVGKSGTPRCEDIRHVFLRADGTLTGRVATGVLTGAKVYANSLREPVWEVL